MSGKVKGKEKNNTRQGVLKVEDKIHMEGKVVEVKGGN